MNIESRSINQLASLAIVVCLTAAGCASKSEVVVVNNGGDTTVTQPNDAELEILIPSDWAIDVPITESEPIDEEGDNGLPPEATETDELCPDGSKPRLPLPQPNQFAVARPGNGIVAYNLYEYDDDASARAAFEAFGDGKCELVAQTSDGEFTGASIWNDSPIDIEKPASFETITFRLGPAGDPNAQNVMLAISGKKVLLVSSFASNSGALQTAANEY